MGAIFVAPVVMAIAITAIFGLSMPFLAKTNIKKLQRLWSLCPFTS